MDKIIVSSIKTEAIIGVYDYERHKKQPLEIDLELFCDMKSAGISDDLADSIDYDELTQKVRKFVSNSKFKLLEALAHGVSQMLMDTYEVKHAIVKIYKPQALEDAKVAIVIERKINS